MQCNKQIVLLNGQEGGKLVVRQIQSLQTRLGLPIGEPRVETPYFIVFKKQLLDDGEELEACRVDLLDVIVAEVEMVQKQPWTGSASFLNKAAERLLPPKARSGQSTPLLLTSVSAGGAEMTFAPMQSVFL
jgi:hypothetical protein